MSKALRLAGKAPTRRPGLALAVIAAASVAVLAGLTTWLRTGWRVIGVALEDQIGDSAQLAGFPLSGAVVWQGLPHRLTFALRPDGSLETALELDDAALQQAPGNQLSQICSYAVPADRRAAVDGAARYDADRERFVSSADTLCPVYTLVLPDQTMLRLRGETFSPEGPVEVESSGAAPYNPLAPNDYTAPGLQELRPPLWTDRMAADQVFRPGAGYGLCWNRNELGRAPGLYRVAGLTREEIASLPADGTVQGEVVLCADTEFGTLTPFYCPGDAAMALGGASMADGSTLLLYLNNDGMLCADLVNAAGTPTDHRELEALGAPYRVNATLLPRSTNTDAVFRLDVLEEQREDGSYLGGEGGLVVLRAAEGRLTLADTFAPDFGSGVDVALLSEAGDRLLLGYDRHTGQNSQVYHSEPTTLNLRVYELDTGHMTYLGRLRTGEERDWTATSHYRYLVYDTLQEDGGIGP